MGFIGDRPRGRSFPWHDVSGYELSHVVRLDRPIGDADPLLLESVAERHGIANASVEEMMVPLNRAPRPSVEPVLPFRKQEKQLGLGLLEKGATRRFDAERDGVVEIRSADD